MSLGAGNSGRSWDLETDRQIAEFKFISWRGGPEAIRQNSLFKDFLYLAEHETDKSKHLYVLGTEVPIKFLSGRRAFTSVLSSFGMSMTPLPHSTVEPFTSEPLTSFM